MEWAAKHSDSRNHRRRSRSRYPSRVTDWDLKPRTVGELLDAAFYVYRRQFFRLAALAVVVSVPALVIVTLNADAAAEAAGQFWDWFQTAMRQPEKQKDFAAFFREEMRVLAKIQPLAILSQALSALSRASAFVCMAIAGSAALRREKAPPFLELLRQGAPRFAPAVLAQFVLDYFVGIGYACCIVPGIILAVVAAPTVVAITLERGRFETSVRARMPAAIRWAVLPFVIAVDGFVRALTLSMHGPTIARGTAFICFLMIFVSVVDTVAAGAATLFVSTGSGWFWAQHYGETVFLPAWGLGLAFWYADLRVRREGLDLAVAA